MFWKFVKYAGHYCSIKYACYGAAACEGAGSLGRVNAAYRPPALQPPPPHPSRAGKHVAFPYTYPPGATYPVASSQHQTHPDTYSRTHRTQQTSEQSQNNRRELSHLVKYFVCSGHLCPTSPSKINRRYQVF
eukprot:566809-Pleurochrysis_carterae.AAC.4